MIGAALIADYPIFEDLASLRMLPVLVIPAIYIALRGKRWLVLAGTVPRPI